MGKQSTDFFERFSAAASRLPIADRDVTVAFSGGVDSTVLLCLLRRLDASRSLTAVHVDHRLYADSQAWAEHCERIARSVGVDFASHRVDVVREAGQSLEEAARIARYRALIEHAAPDGVIVTAHHADDQLETVLLRLLRGTGVRGLGAIHTQGRFAGYSLARPLLSFRRSEIEAEAQRLGIEWLEDPSNADQAFDRNFVRARIVPVITERWPAAAETATRLAAQMRDAETVLGDMAAIDLDGLEKPARLPVGRLLALSPPRRRNALRYAIRALELPVPNAVQLGEIERSLGAREDAEVLVAWPGAEARRYRGSLYLTRPMASLGAADRTFNAGSAFHFTEGELRLVPAHEYGIPDRLVKAGLRVAFRQGGERFRPHGSRHSKSLKHWFQEQAIVPWMRQRVPLVYHDDQLVAVADLCLAADLPQASSDAPFWALRWQGHSPLR